MRRHIINLILLFLIGAVAAFVWMRKEAPESPAEPLVAGNTEQIQRVGFRIPGGASVMAERGESGWQLTEPVAAPADTSVINSLLSTARAAVSDRIPAAEVELAQMGLDNPARYMVFDDVEIAFGAINPVTKKRYVHKGESVFQISDPAGASSYNHHAKLVHKDVIPPGRELVGVVTSDWELRRGDDGWQVTTGDGEASAIDAERAQQVAKTWAEARAMWTALPDSDAADKTTVTLQFADGGQATLHAIRGQQLLLQRPEYRVQYHVAKNLTGVMLDLEAPPKESAGQGSQTPPGEGVMAPAGG